MSAFRMEAHACRIYGMLKLSGNSMSVAELSRRLDIHRHTVRQIVKDRGWEVRDGGNDALDAFNEARGEPQELRF